MCFGGEHSGELKLWYGSTRHTTQPTREPCAFLHAVSACTRQRAPARATSTSNLCAPARVQYTNSCARRRARAVSNSCAPARTCCITRVCTPARTRRARAVSNSCAPARACCIKLVRAGVHMTKLQSSLTCSVTVLCNYKALSKPQGIDCFRLRTICLS